MCGAVRCLRNYRHCGARSIITSLLIQCLMCIQTREATCGWFIQWEEFGLWSRMCSIFIMDYVEFWWGLLSLTQATFYPRIPRRSTVTFRSLKWIVSEVKGALRSFGEEILTRKEIYFWTDPSFFKTNSICFCDWINLINKLALKDNTVSYCFTLYLADPSTSLAANSVLGTLFSSENSLFTQ